MREDGTADYHSRVLGFWGFAKQQNRTQLPGTLLSYPLFAECCFGQEWKIIKNNYDLTSLMKEMNINIDSQQIKREISDLKRMLQQVKQDVPFEKVKTSEFKQSAMVSAGYVPDYVYIMVGIFSLIYWLLGIVFIKGRLRGDLSSSKEMVDSQ